VPYVPLHALAPTCTAVIHHAGAATLATTSLHPVPQLAIHHHYDQPALAAKLAAQGAGIALAADHATGPAVRAALQQLLTKPEHQHAATRLRDEIHALPSPNDIVGQIEQLTTKHHTR
jgi:UDP:flavonoid glycosyltransferase YjiC (YdhE family)